MAYFPDYLIAGVITKLRITTFSVVTLFPTRRLTDDKDFMALSFSVGVKQTQKHDFCHAPLEVPPRTRSVTSAKPRLWERARRMPTL